MNANKNVSFFKILLSLVGVAGISALVSVPAFAFTNLSTSTTGTLHSQTQPPIDDPTIETPEEREEREERERREQEEDQETDRQPQQPQEPQIN
ncbi:hypothetical protein [Anabaenopsis elenkinii]|uniref:Uncharacterized protein n=1 Tax=Anabaenopsis elenkinii CCIBt3563 TaxID=2779889 RepID=A0A7S6RH59_9CYAN|nr:hypothetical protein [Anabaenopsis elenkinii]QOV24806.1 hypothetical protein IM676_14285 [Anabaenopsis elenkinii CCIBt3563]